MNINDTTEVTSLATKIAALIDDTPESVITRARKQAAESRVSTLHVLNKWLDRAAYAAAYDSSQDGE